MTKALTDRVFTLEVEGQPIVAFAADANSEANSEAEIEKEGRILENLKRLKSDGTPLWDAKAAVTVRIAQSDEMSLYRQVAKKATVAPGEFVVAYLIKLAEGHEDRPCEPGAFPPSR